MPEAETGRFELIVVAAPAVRSGARWLAQRMGLRHQDHEDLEQELWLHLLLWWDNGKETASREHRRTVSRAEVRRRVRRLSGVFIRSGSFRRRLAPHRERSSSHWLGDGVASRRFADEQRLCDLQLDVNTTLARLTDELRRPCDRLLNDVSVWPGFRSGNASDYRAAVALRRVFVMHDLHDYL